MTAPHCAQVYTQWGRSKTCSNNHATLYSGLVLTSHNAHVSKAEYVCVDNERAAHLKSSSTNTNGNLWYTTATVGGSMDEALYPDGPSKQNKTKQNISIN